MGRLVLPLLLLGFVWPPGGQAAAPLQLRVLTYNIHHAEGSDGRIDVSRVAAVMAGTRPDLVALQEVDEATTRSEGVAQLAELGRLMGMHAEFGKAMDYAEGAYGVGVLSRWPILAAERHDLPAASDGEPRVALSVRVRIGAGGPLVQFTTTHLERGRDEDARVLQAGRLNALLVPGAGIPAILAGDLNTRRGAAAMDVLEEAWTNTSPDVRLPSDPDVRRRTGVDHVLVRPADRWRVVDATVLEDRVASDHRPLLVVLEWNGE
jgi:endonuclease/exonuclease/phosphatase family metal-dependent hydrolase